MGKWESITGIHNRRGLFFLVRKKSVAKSALESIKEDLSICMIMYPTIK
jgi:hypothetical protein